jgi:NIMA (never in mitosis gene a)-related kinase
VITEAQILTWLSQMSEALAFIHEQNIIHRDIKSQNFFLKKNSVQLGDFGLCRRAVTQTITVGGTDVYMAPEMVLGKRYGKEADVWAMGCVLFEMCTGRFMWEIPGILGAQTAASQQATQKLLNVVPRGYSGGLRTLLGCLLRASPRERPSAAEVFSSLHLNAAAQASEGGAKASQVSYGLEPSHLLHHSDHFNRRAARSPARWKLISTVSLPGQGVSQETQKRNGAQTSIGIHG